MLRLYVWDRVVALASDALGAPGTAFALAESKEQAIGLILEDRGLQGSDTDSTSSWSDAQ
jgi:hypothetical protein